jgi:hypothetical protein
LQTDLLLTISPHIPDLVPCSPLLASMACLRALFASVSLRSTPSGTDPCRLRVFATSLRRWTCSDCPPKVIGGPTYNFRWDKSHFQSTCCFIKSPGGFHSFNNWLQKLFSRHSSIIDEYDIPRSHSDSISSTPSWNTQPRALLIDGSGSAGRSIHPPPPNFYSSDFKS